MSVATSQLISADTRSEIGRLEIGLNHRIALKFGRRIGNTAAEWPVKLRAIGQF